MLVLFNCGCAVYALKLREFPLALRFTVSDGAPQRGLQVVPSAYVLNASGNWLHLPTRESLSQPGVTDFEGQASIVFRETWCDCLLRPFGLTMDSPRMTGLELIAKNPAGESRSFRFEDRFKERARMGLGTVIWGF